MNAFTFAITCPHCGGPLEHIAHGKPSPRQASAMVACESCGSEHHCQVTLHTTRERPGVRGHFVPSREGW